MSTDRRPLLEAKVLPPAVPEGAVVRPRILRALDRGAEQRLTTVVADAGFGKTTALAQWASTRPVAWYTITTDDDDPVSFAGGLTDALRLRAPTLAVEVSVHGHGPGDLVAARERAGARAAALAAAAAEAAAEPLVLVVDGVDRLDPRGAGAALLEALVRQLPAQIRVVLAGRGDLPFAVTRLGEHGVAVVLGARQLALDAGETVEVLAGVLAARLDGDRGRTADRENDSGPDRDDPDLDALGRQLHALTGGWPAAVRLAAELISEQRSGDVDRLGQLTAPDAGLDLLVDEVLAREPPEVLAVLGLLATLPRFTDELAEIVAGPDALPFLDRMRARGVLVTRIGGGWATVPPLVRNVLRARGPAPDRARIRAAATWSVDQGLAGEGLQMLVDAGDVDGIARTLAAAGSSVVAAGHAPLVLRAVEVLGPGDHDPAIDRVEGEARQVLGDWEGALERLARLAPAEGPVPAAVAWRLGLIHHLRGELEPALRVYERCGDGTERDRALASAWHASARWLRGERDRCAQLATSAERLARSSGDRQALAAAHTALALLAALDGDRAANDAHYLRALDHAIAAGDLLQMVRIRANRGSHDLEEGRYREALTELDEAVRLADVTGFASFGALALTNRAEVLLRLGRLEEARRDLAVAIDAERRVGSRMVAYPLGHLGEVHRLRGDLAAARAAYEEAIATAAEVGDVQGTVPALCGLALVLAELGEHHAAQRAVAEALAAPTNLAGPHSLVVAGRVALARGDLQTASTHADAAAELAREHRDRALLAGALEVLAASDDEDTPGRLRQAVALWHELGEPISAARAELALAEVLPAGEAGPVASRAMGTLRDHGARRLAARAADLVMRVAHPDAQRPVVIRALGGLAVLRHGRPVPSSDWPGPEARTLVSALAAAGGASRLAELVDLLCPDVGAPVARSRLEAIVADARRVLDPDGSSPPDRFIEIDHDVVRLRPDEVWVDVAAFVEAARTVLDPTALDPTASDPTALDPTALAGAPSAPSAPITPDVLYRGDLLEGEAAWAEDRRAELRATYLQVVRSGAEAALARGEHDAAIRGLLRLLEHQPDDEAAHLGLARTMAAAGRPAEARRAYRLYCARMAEAGTEPAPFPG